MVFIDGQNAVKATQALYGRLYSHPLLLARRTLAGRRLCGVRYYSGIHDPRANPDQNAVAQRRHALMRKVGVTVVERPLRYRWEWGFDPDRLPDPYEHRGSTRSVKVAPYQRAREKGIDLTLGLDLMEFALDDRMDVAVIVSSDTDLCEAARAVHSLTGRKKRVSVEAAIFTSRKVKLQHYDFTQRLNGDDFDECKDSFNYRDALDPMMVEMFKATCAPLQPERAV